MSRGLSSRVFLYALAIPEISSSFDRIKKRLENRKPKYYKVNLTKEERRGKTSEEIQALRIRKYEELNNEQKSTDTAC